MGGRSRATLTLVLALLASSLVASPAEAACNWEYPQHLFRRAETSEADGARSTLWVRNRELDGYCTADAEVHSTVHMRNSSNDKFAEVGYHQEYGVGGTHNWNVFWEVKIGDVVTGHLNNGQSINCCVPIELKVVSDPGTNYWKFWVKYNNGTWTQIGPSAGQPAGFNMGSPRGETARRGDNTGASDEHKDLQRKMCGSCAWGNWGSNYLATNEIPGWSSRALSNYHYEVYRQ